MDNDILNIIFDYLAFRETITCMHVCSKWRQLILKNKKFPNDYEALFDYFLQKRWNFRLVEIIAKNPLYPWEKIYPMLVDDTSSKEKMRIDPAAHWSTLPWNDKIAKRADVTWDDVVKNGHIKWSYKYLGRNPNITLDIIENNKDIRWTIDTISKNPNISLKYIRSKPWPLERWDLAALMKNPGIKWEDIKSEHIFRKYSYEISMNSNITWDIVKANPRFPWSYPGLSRNPNITYEIIMANPSAGWDSAIERLPISWKRFVHYKDLKVLAKNKKLVNMQI